MSKELLTSADATRPGYGLRGRLLLSFIAISSFAAIAAIVGTYALYTIGKALYEMRQIEPPDEWAATRLSNAGNNNLTNHITAHLKEVARGRTEVE